MVADAFAATRLTATLKVAVVAPAATVTDAGTVAAAVLELESVTTVPPAGAAADKVIFPVLDVPPITEVGVRTRLLRRVFTVNTAVFVTPE